MYSSDRTISPAFSDLEGMVERSPGQGVGDSVGVRASPRFIPLTLQSLRERIILLTEIGLPCLVTLGATGGCVAFTLLTGWRGLDGDGLCLLGDSFSVPLRCREIGSIKVVYQDVPEQSLAVRMEDHAGALIASLVGMPNPCEGAVWADVMGNPCYTPEERS